MTGGGTEPRHGPDLRPHLLLGALSLDIYLGRDLVLPGGGVLNMAWQWRRAGVPFRLLSRVGDDRPDVFRGFLDRHGIPPQAGLVAPGRSASIDIVIQPDLQPFMDNFVEGVWATFRLLPDEEALVAGAAGLHLVLVEGAIRELRRLATRGTDERPRGQRRLPELPALHRRADGGHDGRRRHRLRGLAGRARRSGAWPASAASRTTCGSSSS